MPSAIRVVAIRFAAMLFGGMASGLAGAYMSLAYTPDVGGEHDRGPRLDRACPGRLRDLAAGAAAARRLSLRRHHHSAAACPGPGLHIPSQFLSMLPYLATILVLVLISRDRTRIRLNAPACLGRPFSRRRLS